MWDIFKLKKAGIFAGGVLFGTAGVKILASDDAKKGGDGQLCCVLVGSVFSSSPCGL